MFQKLGIADEEDIDKLKRRFGVKSKQDEQNIDEVLASKSNLGKKTSRRKIANEEQAKDDLKRLILERNEQKEQESMMDEHELIELQKEKAKIQEKFRDETLDY